MAPALTVLVPVYNEAPTVERALEALLETDLGLEFEVVVIDDGSTDGTQTILGERRWNERVRLVTHGRNQGKGAAVRPGIREARGEVTAIFDADLEYDPSDLALVVNPVLGGESNAVFGVRAFEGHTSHSFLYVMGNRGVTLAANLLFNVYLGDLMTCHKAVRTEVMQALPLKATGFEIEPEIAARLLQAGERIYEVPVSYRARASDEGKKLTASDGLRVLRTLVRCRLSRIG
ncbi:MAG: glycosyltransferase family 2 protein [Thermoleophilaceae bacterium]|nr:glycosyltransferase family 2 protein [Thermoleophilaceae bacterium]